MQEGGARLLLPLYGCHFRHGRKGETNKANEEEDAKRATLTSERTSFEEREKNQLLFSFPFIPRRNFVTRAGETCLQKSYSPLPSFWRESCWRQFVLEVLFRLFSLFPASTKGEGGGGGLTATGIRLEGGLSTPQSG